MPSAALAPPSNPGARTVHHLYGLFKSLEHLAQAPDHHRRNAVEVLQIMAGCDDASAAICRSSLAYLAQVRATLE